MSIEAPNITNPTSHPPRQSSLEAVRAGVLLAITRLRIIKTTGGHIPAGQNVDTELEMLYNTRDLIEGKTRLSPNDRRTRILDNLSRVTDALQSKLTNNEFNQIFLRELRNLHNEVQSVRLPNSQPQPRIQRPHSDLFTSAPRTQAGLLLAVGRLTFIETGENYVVPGQNIESEHNALRHIRDLVEDSPSILNTANGKRRIARDILRIATTLRSKLTNNRFNETFLRDLRMLGTEILGSN